MERCEQITDLEGAKSVVWYGVVQKVKTINLNIDALFVVELGVILY